MNSFSTQGMVNSSIPSLPSPPPNLTTQHLKSEPYNLPPASRPSEDTLGVDLKSGPYPKDEKMENRWKEEIGSNGMTSPEWHGSAGFMGSNVHHFGSNNSVPLPPSSCSPDSHPHSHPSVTFPCNNDPIAMSESSAPLPLCAGCSLRIVDKFYLSAVEAKWHTACLKCSECGVELESQNSCFEKNGQIYCKDDYVR